MCVEDKIKNAETLASSNVGRDSRQGGVPVTKSIEKLDLIVSNITIHISSEGVRDIILDKLDELIPIKLKALETASWRHSRWTTIKTVLKLAITNISENSLGPMDEDTKPSSKSGNLKKVFIVHGRNINACGGIFEVLRPIELNTVEWAEYLNLSELANPTIDEILEKAFKNTQAVIFLVKLDDLARLSNEYLQNSNP